VSVTLDPGTAIVLFTDGLFERRGEDVDLGLSRIADAATSLRRGELSEALVTMVDLGRDPTRDDDVAVLVMRTQA
jgi:serine phosphatase RsbU (regulator of sigma subunit)